MTQQNEKQTSAEITPRMWPWYTALLIGLCILAWSVWSDINVAPASSIKTAQLITAANIDGPKAATTEPVTLPISQIRPGMRVQAFNPEVSNQERAAWEQVDYSKWIIVDILVTDSEGNPVYLELLRPIEWVLTSNAWKGNQVELDFPELNVSALGRVTSLRACGSIYPGTGKVVTGVFSHKVRDLIDIRIEGQADPIGVTQTHPIWSEDRQAFVQAATLQPGERLRSMVGGSDGGLARVMSISPRGPPSSGEIVHNLEVEGEHAYQVTGLGLVVHNNGELCQFPLARDLTKEMDGKSYGLIPSNGGSGPRRWQQIFEPPKLPSTHGNSLAATGSHDLYAIIDIKTREILHIGETGRGIDIRGAEWGRHFEKLGIATESKLLGRVEGKRAVKELETIWIQRYKDLFGKLPPHNKGLH